MDVQYVSQGMLVEVPRFAMLRVKKLLQGYKGGGITLFPRAESGARSTCRRRQAGAGKPIHLAA
jgi:hypothetical protein